MPDAHKNFAYSTVATAPSPASSGTSLVVASGDGAKFPTVPFNATVWPTGAQPTTANAEIVRVTAISTDTLTITRAQESSSARTVVVGDQIAATVTAKTLSDGDIWTPSTAPSLVGHAALYDGSAMVVKVIRGFFDAGVQVANLAAASPATMMSAPFTAKAPFTAGDTYRIIAAGTYLNNTGGALTPSLAFFLGGVNPALYSSQSQTSNAATRAWFMEGVAVVEVVNASGTLGFAGRIWMPTAVGTGWAVTAGNVESAMAATVSLDTTADFTIDVKGGPGVGANAHFDPHMIVCQRFPKV